MMNCGRVAVVAVFSLLAVACGTPGGPPPAAESAGHAPRTLPDLPRFVLSCDDLFRRAAEWDSATAEAFLEEIRRHGGFGAPAVDQARRTVEAACRRQPYYGALNWLRAGPGRGPEGASPEALLQALPAAIHEEGHAWHSIGGVGSVYRSAPFPLPGVPGGVGLLGDARWLVLRLPDGRVLAVPYRPEQVFPARQIAPLVPESARTGRFGIYVFPSGDHQSTQTSGIYGLINEYFAYAYSLAAEEAARPERLALAIAREGQDARTAAIRFPAYAGAFLEFKLYILLYFRHARAQHESTYRALVGNRALVEAFVALHDPFEAMARESIARYDRWLMGRNAVSRSERTRDVRAEWDDLFAEVSRPENVEMLAELRRLSAQGAKAGTR